MPDQAGTRLVVLNLSQQTDSADFLGGFRPMEPREALLPLLNAFQVGGGMQHWPNPMHAHLQDMLALWSCALTWRWAPARDTVVPFSMLCLAVCLYVSWVSGIQLRRIDGELYTLAI